MDSFLREVEARIVSYLERPAPDTLRAAASHLVLADGAKRARPRLTQSFGAALGVPNQPLVDIATAAELIHSASLLHDDVIDAGTLRRGRATANARFGNHAAVLSGDMVICLALQALRGHPAETTALGIDVIAQMTAGAIREVEARGNPLLDYTAWRAIARDKTGVLFAFCGAAPALWAGDRDAASAFSEVGDRLGVAFQLADDLHDADERRGKDAFADLRQRNPSSLIALASEASPSFRGRLQEAWSSGQALEPDTLAALVPLLNASGASARLRETLEAEVSGALAILSAYHGRPGVAEVEAWAHALGGVARRGI